MKLTETEIDFFKSIHKSEVATQFVSYLERLSNYICDSRNWDSLNIKDKEIANSAAKVLKEMVINKVRLQNKSKDFQEYEWE